MIIGTKMKDLKYLAALSIPATAFIGLYFQGYWSFFTPVFSFVLIPIFEILLPQDNSNYTSKTIENKSINIYPLETMHLIELK